MLKLTALEGAIASLAEVGSEVASAADVLKSALADLRVTPRAQKTAVSQTIESALERLRTARSKVEEAERTIAREKQRLE